jgi:hypothetical protein
MFVIFRYWHCIRRLKQLCSSSYSTGALYKALACFSLRDIDCTKIESRPTSASLLNFLKFKSQQLGSKARNKAALPRFRYCFYLDFLATELDENTQNALSHLKEQADFLRVLGSYPQKSKLVGPVASAVKRLKLLEVDPQKASLTTLPSDLEATKPLNIGILGFGSYGQFLARRMTRNNRVTALDILDKVNIKTAKKLIECKVFHSSSAPLVSSCSVC